MISPTPPDNSRWPPVRLPSMARPSRVSIANTRSRPSHPVRLTTSPRSARSSTDEPSRALNNRISRISSSSTGARGNSRVHWKRCNKHQNEKISPPSPIYVRSPNERKKSSSPGKKTPSYSRKDPLNSSSSSVSATRHIAQPSVLIDPLGANPCDGTSSTNFPDSVLPPARNS